MIEDRPLGSPKVDMVYKTLGGPFGPGELGVVMARAGVGKTACLTHIAIEHLLRGNSVLHVCIGEIPEKIKVWYHEFLKNVARTEPAEDFSRLQQRVEPLRFILAYLHQTFTPDKLEQSVRNLEEQTNFRPSLVILDGLDFEKISGSTIGGLQGFAERHKVSMWMSAKTHRHISTVNARGIPYPCHEIDELFQAILSMELDAAGDIELKVLKHGDRYMPDYPAVYLNSQTFLVKRADQG